MCRRSGPYQKHSGSRRTIRPSGTGRHHLVEQIAWLTWRLTGEWVIPLNTAAAKWHYRARDDGSVPAGWPMGLLRAVDLAELPEKVPGNPLTMGSRGGDLSAAAAAELGLSPGIAVAMSGIDATPVWSA